jgi:hypothetical protein
VSQKEARVIIVKNIATKQKGKATKFLSKG